MNSATQKSITEVMTLETGKIIHKGSYKVTQMDPTIWTALSSVIFEVLHKRNVGIKCISFLSKKKGVLIGFAYVDNCDITQSGEKTLELMHYIQILINSWGSLMEDTVYKTRHINLVT